MRWYMDGILIGGSEDEGFGPTESQPLAATDEKSGPSHHYPGHRLGDVKSSATHGRFPGHRHAVKAYERSEAGAGTAGEGKGSWFGQHKGKYTWRDPGDRPGSAASGLGDEVPGIALPSRSTLGQWFDVTGPDGKTHRVRQTDVGPAPRTGHKIDINAALAEQMGYSPGDFPTGGHFKWSPAGRGAGEHRHFPGHRGGGVPDPSPGGIGLPGTGDTSHLNPDFKDRLRRMIKDAPADVRDQLSIVSGYRTPAHQAELYRQSGGSGMVARPGHSMHERGLAVDLSFKGNMKGGGDARDWVHQHAHEYGLHFPMGFEPWHIEPEGVRRGAASPHEGDPFGVHRMQDRSDAEKFKALEGKGNVLPTAMAFGGEPRGPPPNKDAPKPKEHHGGGGRFYDPNLAQFKDVPESGDWSSRVLGNTFTSPSGRAGKVELPDTGYTGDPNIGKYPGKEFPGGEPLYKYWKPEIEEGLEEGWSRKEGDITRPPDWQIEPGTTPPPTAPKRINRHDRRRRRRR